VSTPPSAEGIFISALQATPVFSVITNEFLMFRHGVHRPLRSSSQRSQSPAKAGFSLFALKRIDLYFFRPLNGKHKTTILGALCGSAVKNV
jgi:hypothetical protein